MEQSHKGMGNYRKFFTMIGTSTVVMFFLMYAHSYLVLEHARFSETRFFMALLMGSAMTIIMLFFMRNMYKNDRFNTAIFVGAGLMLILSIWLVRSQVTVTGVDYMEGMIPHHSIAILTSERAQIEDVRVRQLADEIIKAQQREIKEMDWLIEDIRTNGVARTEAEAATRPMPDFSGTSD